MSKETIRQDMLFVKEQIDEVLKSKANDVCETIVQIANMDYVCVLAEGDNELEIIELLVRIHTLERQERVGQTVLSKADSLEELLGVYYRILFGLQRFWFELEEEYRIGFIAYLYRNGITPYAVYMILQDSRIAEKERVWEEVTCLWEGYHE